MSLGTGDSLEHQKLQRFSAITSNHLATRIWGLSSNGTVLRLKAVMECCNSDETLSHQPFASFCPVLRSLQV